MLNALLWNLPLTAGLAIVLTALCRLPSMHKRPALRHLLWLLLLAKLITPPLIGVPLLPANLSGDDATAIATPPSVPSGDRELALDERTYEGFAAGDTAFAFVGEGAGRDEREATAGELRSGTQMSYLGGLFAISLIGTCVLLIVHGVRTARLCRWLKRAGTEDSLLAETCASVASSLEIRGVVRSCVVNARMAPLLWAWHRPLVVMPRQLIDDLKPQELRSIIAHELAHYLRRDHWTNVFAFVVKVLLWWNPVVWWADRELRAAQELCCDAIAIDRCRANRRVYATTLLKALDFVQAEPLVPREFALGMGTRGSILRRFEMIGETRLSYRLSRWTPLVLLVLGIPLVCIPIRAQEEEPTDVTPPAEVAERGEGTVKSPQGLDHINASPMNKAGVYHISSVFQKLAKVTVIQREGPYGWDHTRTLEGWNYDKKTGQLTMKETVDDGKEMVVVYGKRTVPWAWQMQGPISDVKVLIGKEAAVRGEDYEVDEAAGTVRFRKKELCKKGVQYYICYVHRDEPSKSGSIGNHPDRALVRKFLGTLGQKLTGTTEDVYGKRPRGTVRLAAKSFRPRPASQLETPECISSITKPSARYSFARRPTALSHSKTSPRVHFRCSRHVLPDTKMSATIPKASPATGSSRFRLKTASNALVSCSRQSGPIKSPARLLTRMGRYRKTS